MADFLLFRNLVFTNGFTKSSALQWVVHFFEGLNFTNDQHPRKSWNLRTLKKTNYTVMEQHYQIVVCLRWLLCSNNASAIVGNQLNKVTINRIPNEACHLSIIYTGIFEGLVYIFENRFRTTMTAIQLDPCFIIVMKLLTLDRCCFKNST